MDRPDYINKNIKKVDPDHLRKVLRDLHAKHEADRRQMRIDTAKALADGFRCM